MPNPIDITGHTYGRLTVLEQRPSVRGKTMWFCKCTCGGSIETQSNKLRTGHVSSCGCLRRENAKNNRHKGRVHGHSKANTPTYRSWSAMRSRCTWVRHHAFDRYGGRGITVCQEWDDFEVFLRDMGERPGGKSIDRIDNNKGYFKENCRWATRSEQQWNRSGYGDSSPKRQKNR